MESYKHVQIEPISITHLHGFIHIRLLLCACLHKYVESAVAHHCQCLVKVVDSVHLQQKHNTF